MRICIPSEGTDPSAEMDSMFGRARYFIIVDEETGKHEFIDNSDCMDCESGVGIQAANRVVDKDVDCVVSGHMGPRALKLLQEAEVQVYCGATGLVWDAIEAFQADELHELDEADMA